MRIIINGRPKEIATLVLAVQGRQISPALTSRIHPDTIRDILEECRKQPSARQQLAHLLGPQKVEQSAPGIFDSVHIPKGKH